MHISVSGYYLCSRTFLYKFLCFNMELNWNWIFNIFQTYFTKGLDYGRIITEFDSKHSFKNSAEAGGLTSPTGKYPQMEGKRCVLNLKTNLWQSIVFLNLLDDPIFVLYLSRVWVNIPKSTSYSSHEQNVWLAQRDIIIITIFSKKIVN